VNSLGNVEWGFPVGGKLKKCGEVTVDDSVSAVCETLQGRRVLSLNEKHGIFWRTAGWGVDHADFDRHSFESTKLANSFLNELNSLSSILCIFLQYVIGTADSPDGLFPPISTKLSQERMTCVAMSPQVNERC
jgi:hypothetical protein